MQKTLLLVALILGSHSSWANIVINGTRVIYPENNKEVVVQLINNGDTPALVQSWIDDGDINSTPETAHVPFMLSPPVVKVNGNNGQQLRIKKIEAKLPKDRESVFFLNVLDIPPAPDHLKGVNTIQLAIKSRVKVFYRPAVLAGRQNEAMSGLKLIVENNHFRIVNDSPFHITIANIETSAKQKLLAESVMVPPFTHITTAAKANLKRNQSYQVIYVDDLGAYKTRDVASQ
ncbi:MAG: fimbrial biogenesis chaperone [Silvania sp.]|uniref:fimbrial biogenesis chaperone n=1 Tax=Silvania sp. TaxID=3016633 RepID=UPI003EE7D5BF